jgi:magnesium-transporting ATPase (P-type)
VATFRFDPRRKLMTTVVSRDGIRTAQTQGAPEQVIARSSILAAQGERTMSQDDRAGTLVAVDQLAERGLRVLALATRTLLDLPATNDEAENNLCLLGMVALVDTPRPEVADAVTACHAAGIRVNVVTGDYGRTAAAIAREVGIGAEHVVAGDLADAMSEAEPDKLLSSGEEIVFARSAPEGKLRIAEALRTWGEVVAMTGDGVNGAPALHQPISEWRWDDPVPTSPVRRRPWCSPTTSPPLSPRYARATAPLTTCASLCCTSSPTRCLRWCRSRCSR